MHSYVDFFTLAAVLRIGTMVPVVLFSQSPMTFYLPKASGQEQKNDNGKKVDTQQHANFITKERSEAPIIRTV